MEYNRIRKHGTEETVTSDNNSKIEKIRKVVIEKQYAKINGVMVDVYTASAIIKVFDAINAKNKIKFIALPIPRMASIAFSLLK